VNEQEIRLQKPPSEHHIYHLHTGHTEKGRTPDTVRKQPWAWSLPGTSPEGQSSQPSAEQDRGPSVQVSQARTS
jgi:hypothetical protein